MTDVLYTVPEVAKLLKTNVAFVHRLRKAGLLRFMKLGTYKVRAAELDRFLAASEGLDLTDPDNVHELEEARNEKV